MTSDDVVNYSFSEEAHEEFGHVARLDFPNGSRILVQSSQISFQAPDSEDWLSCSWEHLAHGFVAMSKLGYTEEFMECLERMDVSGLEDIDLSGGVRGDGDV